MAEIRAIFDQVNVVARDVNASLDFYRRLGVEFPRAVPNSAGELFHVSAKDDDNTALFELDSVPFAPLWNAAWAGRDDLAGRVVIGFHLPTRDAVDARFNELTNSGYRGLQPPFDAFWGARYAIVEDPDGVAVGLMSDVDPALRSALPEEWT